MLSINLKNIPKYLRESEFVSNLNTEESFEIPKKFYKKDDSVNSLLDYNHLFETSNYFGIPYPETMLNYFLLNKEEVFNYYYPKIEEMEVIFMFQFNKNFKKLLDIKTKKIIDEIINYLNEKELYCEKEYKYYNYNEFIGLKSKLKKKYVKITVLLLNAITSGNYKIFYKPFDSLKNCIKYLENIEVELQETNEIGNFLSLNKFDSTLVLDSRGYFIENLKEKTFECIEYHYNLNIFNAWNKEKKYLDNNYYKIKYRFIVSEDEINSGRINNLQKFRFLRRKRSIGEPMINIYFSTEKEVQKYIEKNKEYFKENFGIYKKDYIDKEMIMSHLETDTFFKEEMDEMYL
uniref:Uncharacterized protein n=1 Tax=viral metagenome TaxID=1070528 RepID=A0A6C0ADZ1_9ZZZZ